MLDFYLIDNDQPKPKGSGQGKMIFAGALDDVTFDRLQRLGLIESPLDYYNDFRWKSESVKQKYTKIFTGRLDSNTDVQKLYAILCIAKNQNCGLQAYCD